MFEIIRRIGLVACVLIAIVLALQPVSKLFKVAAVDFEAEYKKEIAEKQDDPSLLATMQAMMGEDPQLSPTLAAMQAEGAALEAARQPLQEQKQQQTLQEYIDEKTDKALLRVQGGAWPSFFKRVSEITLKKSPAEDWEARLNIGWSAGQALYFRPDEAPLSDIREDLARLNRSSLRVYLALAGQNVPYLSVFTQEGSNSLRDDAPPGMVYPTRIFSPWFVLAGAITYIAIPWRRRTPTMVGYSLVRHIILPDIIGMAMLSLFFAMPFFIIFSSSSAASVFEPGWLPLTLVFWFMALLFSLFLVFSTLYAVFWADIQPERLIIGGFGKPQTLYFGEIESCQHFSVQLPQWAIWAGRLLAILALFARARGSSVAMFGLGREQGNGILIHLKDGTQKRIWDNEMPAFQRILKALEKAGIPFIE